MLLSAALLSAALLTGCGQPKIRPVEPDSVVVAFGDSLTEGVGADAEENYPAVLAKLLGCKVVNAGVSGEVSGEGAARLPEVLIREKPDLVVICHGGNDFLRHLGDAEVARNLRTMVAAVRETGADVVVLGVPHPGLILKAPPLYGEIARENGVPCDLRTVPRILSTPRLKSDTIHPNAAGYRLMAERVAACLRKNGG